jgi:ribosomal protein S18 acetylase RimI-like enzyme
MMGKFIRVATKKEYTSAVQLFREYAAWLGIDLCFQNFETELKELDGMYAKPFGGIILYKQDDEFSGCVGIRKQQDDIAEMKRMYVRSGQRKQGIGNGLLQEAILLAKELGYKKIRLDTLNTMISAMALYRKHGFKEIDAYYHNPEETAIYFEKEL